MLATLPCPWWFAGGWAIDLFLGKQTREHADLDVGFLRRDFAVVRSLLADWEIWEAKDGALTLIGPEGVPRGDVHSLWCRPVGARDWELELMLEESAAETWMYRRERSLRRPVTSLVARSTEGWPYLAPEVQLLYKSRQPRARDQADFEAALPTMTTQARAWLQRSLEATESGHRWIEFLSAFGTPT